MTNDFYKALVGTITGDSNKAYGGKEAVVPEVVKIDSEPQKLMYRPRISGIAELGSVSKLAVAKRAERNCAFSQAKQYR